MYWGAKKVSFSLALFLPFLPCTLQIDASGGSTTCPSSLVHGSRVAETGFSSNHREFSRWAALVCLGMWVSGLLSSPLSQPQEHTGGEGRGMEDWLLRAHAGCAGCAGCAGRPGPHQVVQLRVGREQRPLGADLGGRREARQGGLPPAHPSYRLPWCLVLGLPTCLAKAAMSSLKESEEQTSPPGDEPSPAEAPSRGEHVASSHFSKTKAKRGKRGCLGEGQESEHA